MYSPTFDMFDDLSVYFQNSNYESYVQNNQQEESNSLQEEKQQNYSKNEEDFIIDWNNEEENITDMDEKKMISQKLENVFKKHIVKENKRKLKNECRNIIGNAINYMDHTNLPNDFIIYYKKVGSTISGFQSLKQHLLINNDDDEQSSQRKRLFKEYLIEFLQKKASLYILRSKKKINLGDYLRYKNQILYYYVRYPEQWSGNQLPKFDQFQPKK